VCRVAPSFTRFGDFESPASRGDVDLLEQLIEFTIRRDFAELSGSDETPYAEWFAQVREQSTAIQTND
jgi:uncharacterized protein YdiU (UPF0061 family)